MVQSPVPDACWLNTRFNYYYHFMLQEPSLLRNAIAFYRLMATWLMRMAFPPLTQGQLPFVPLPDPTPVQFRCLPVRPHPCHGRAQCFLIYFVMIGLLYKATPMVVNTDYKSR